MTSAAVSARIKLLENQLGVQLFHRTRGNMQLTAEGERLLPLAENMISTWSRALQEVALQPEMETRLHIGTTASLWTLAMQDQLLVIREDLPEIAIQAEGHSHDTLSRLLSDKLLDLVFVMDPQADPSVCSEEIGQLHLTLGAKGKKDIKDALLNGYIYVDWGTAFSGFHARKFGEMVRPALHVNQTSIAISVLEAVGGAAYLPRSAIDETIGIQVVEGAPVFLRPIYACYLQQNPRVDLIREVIALTSRISI